jgi:hypothetical protein
MQEYIEKISKIFNERDLPVHQLDCHRLKGFRIPPLQHYFLYQVNPVEVRIKALCQITSINSQQFQGAVHVNLYVGEQDLHLFNVKKNFTKKFYKFDNVINLKVPNIILSKERLLFFVELVVKDRYKAKLISKKKNQTLNTDNELFKYNYF